MIKRFFFLLAFFFIGLHADSQVLITIIFGDKLNSPNLEFGLEGGLNWSKISSFETAKPLTSFNLGFYFDFKVKKDFYVYTGVLVKSTLGVAHLTKTDISSINATIYPDNNGIDLEGTYRQKLSYFLVPVLAKYRHPSNIYIEGGFQGGLMYKSWVEFNSNDNGRETVIKEYNKDYINKIDIGALVGTGYKFKSGPGWSLGVKYYYGFIDVYKNKANSKNSSIFLKLNIPIGAHKTKE